MIKRKGGVMIHEFPRYTFISTAREMDIKFFFLADFRVSNFQA